MNSFTETKNILVETSKRSENEKRAVLSGECFYRVGTLAWLRNLTGQDRMKSEGNAPHGKAGMCNA